MNFIPIPMFYSNARTYRIDLLVRWLLLTSHRNKRETKINGKIMLNSPRRNFTRDKNHIIYTRETNDDGILRFTE